jgi:ABC-type nickel/cobalt efflux system permease component RcnA
MLALGLLFILGAVAVTAGAIYDGGESASFELFGQTIGTTISGVFMAGFATMLVFILGVWMLMSAMSRGRRKRLERKETKARQRESVSQIEQERAQLRAENEQLQERLGRESRPTTAAAGDSDTRTDTPMRPGDESRMDGARSTDQTTTTDGNDRVVDHTTDLTSREEEKAASTSARHREI